MPIAAVLQQLLHNSLLAHELAHTEQQKGRVPGLKTTDNSDPSSAIVMEIAALEMIVQPKLQKVSDIQAIPPVRKISEFSTPSLQFEPTVTSSGGRKATELAVTELPSPDLHSGSFDAADKSLFSMIIPDDLAIRSEYPL